MVQVRLESNLLGANEMLARKNRGVFQSQGLLVINLMSSPGSGKTTLLEKTIEYLGDRLKIGVIEGDLYTDQDARRIEQKGVRVIQINTEGACHLDAGMVGKAFAELPGDDLDLLFIENVGNLVCPAEFDLGEDFKAVVISTTEGNDKPLKYPLIFREARVILLNKIDLLPYTDFSLERFREDLAQINPTAPVFLVSGRTGQGIKEWNEWLLGEVRTRGIKD
ncbi:Hydrogenase accessory protein HypB [Syntrophomonas zehnderi OL-4]|uniref:Hydrogenase accessory protein HypB n=1 Tax=Syntrophomonas zehnderi OL-4 TaxID=690567 RepID=A0A0E3W2X0_9FIRM|nr:hydrogenase nickel incorporation protein HypB [Syntrophomonas zehnderi]CFX27907.1 Hydrogenase accessory protein HypB [Syntrophomonas zehnderi OL-4]